MNIFVGNLSFEAKESDIQEAFLAFGAVDSVIIVKEKKGEKSRGFGFVRMPNESEALAAIEALNGKEILGRPVNVMPALSKKPKKRRFEHKKKKVINTEVSLPQAPLQRTGKYREGRRTIGYFKKRQQAGITTSVFERKFKPNPMRWRKKTKQDYRNSQPETKPYPKPYRRDSKLNSNRPSKPKYGKSADRGNKVRKIHKQPI